MSICPQPCGGCHSLALLPPLYSAAHVAPLCSTAYVVSPPGLAIVCHSYLLASPPPDLAMLVAPPLALTGAVTHPSFPILDIPPVPSYTGDLAPPPCSLENTALPPCLVENFTPPVPPKVITLPACLSEDATLSTCLGEDAAPPPCSGEDAALPPCSSSHVPHGQGPGQNSTNPARDSNPDTGLLENPLPLLHD
ncbi:hypothetical protein KOW79_016766 [Hemibagrus wyckioides]|uniref:Uncharacterized protein n=1 Tax=Hemibagrus wyckioides TaxID=337641 RepID=A0A9D3SHG4_9TELE|nr:hypothetical protein KOW79_016766 [Hemibagrus wyckioides]